MSIGKQKLEKFDVKSKLEKIDYSKYLDSAKIEKNFIPAIKELKFKSRQVEFYMRFRNRRRRINSDDNSNY